MSYQIETRLKGGNPVVQICDASSGSVRLAWEYPRASPELSSEDDEALLALRKDEAVHELFRRLFLLTTEQYLKGEVTAIPEER